MEYILKLPYQQKLLEKKLKKEGELLLSITGDSMQPLLRQEEHIRVKKADKIEAGDIIVFTYENELLVHRVLYVREEYIYCKGDNSFRIEKAQCSDVIGRVMGVVTEQGEVMLPRPGRKFLDMSFAVGREFIRLNKDRDSVYRSKIYREYKNELEVFRQYRDGEWQIGC